MKKDIRWTVKDMSIIRSFQQSSLTVLRTAYHGNEWFPLLSRQRLLKRFMRNEGFTLIELLMVVIILGILAAVVIPQFSGSTEDAKISALKSNLSSIRSSVELYQVQHNSKYPDPNIGLQLTRYTDPNGVPSITKSSVYKYGPYLKQGFPKNPFDSTTDPAGVVIGTETAIGEVKAQASPAKGWKYVPATGEFIANTSGYDQY